MGRLATNSSADTVYSAPTAGRSYPHPHPLTTTTVVFISQSKHNNHHSISRLEKLQAKERIHVPHFYPRRVLNYLNCIFLLFFHFFHFVMLLKIDIYRLWCLDSAEKVKSHSFFLSHRLLFRRVLSRLTICDDRVLLVPTDRPKTFHNLTLQVVRSLITQHYSPH